MAAPALVADIGGTNARFALIEGAAPLREVATMRCADHPDIGAAIAAYLADAAPATPPAHAAIAVAAPVTGDTVDFTNGPWAFSIAALERELGVAGLRVVNDFTAIALALPALGAGDVRQIGGGKAVADAPRAVLGPGTGFGISGLVPCAEAWTPLATEGGHMTLAAATAREAEIVAGLRAEFGHVSAERAISGSGLRNIYRVICGNTAEPPAPDAITAAAIDRSDPVAVETFDLFCAFLGTVAADVALALGALGGVYIAGGIVPRLVDAFAASPFRARFEDKGRYRAYMAAIPTAVIAHPHPALIGLARLLAG